MFTEQEELPDSNFERAQMLQNILVSHATGEKGNEIIYQALRKELMANVELKPLLPTFVRTSRSLDQFWGYIKKESGQWQPRREHIWDSFTPLLDYLEGQNISPSDKDIGDTLRAFDREGVHEIWQKALERRQTDPEGAITVARTLLESVCKRILEEEGVKYQENATLPFLYNSVAEMLNLAPSQHSEKVFKAILGNAQQVVNSLGNIRNMIGDAHGRGGKPIRPAPRHAALAVNLSGSMATFLVDTWKSKKDSDE